MISIVTATFNAAKVIDRNLSAMSQQRAKFEHIIQDGESTDYTQKAVEKYQSDYDVKFYKEPDNGIYDAISKGMAKANGDILGWLGADDYYLPWTLSTVESVFAQFPEIDWITGIPAQGFDEGRLTWTASLAPVYLRTCIKNGWHKPGCLGFLEQECIFWRRSLWEKVCGGDIIRQYRHMGEYHLWKAFANHARLHTVGTPLAVFSVSPQQNSAKNYHLVMREIDPKTKFMGRNPSFIGTLFNRSVSILSFRKVLRPGFGFRASNLLN